MSVTIAIHDPAAIEAFLVEQIEEFGAEPGTVTLDATIEDLGLDSLDVVELTQTVKKQLGVPVNPKDFFAANTVGDAVAIILDKAGEV